jgi:hypothetical protein
LSTSAREVSVGVLSSSFPLSIAVLNLVKIMEFEASSCLTRGTVYTGLVTANGSNPAMKADVSRTRDFLLLSPCCVRIYAPARIGVSLLVCGRNRL